MHQLKKEASWHPKPAKEKDRIMKLLDCTLRDGGYYTNWDFDRSLVDLYIEQFNQLPVDYLELGYRSLPMRDYLGEYFYCPLPVLSRIRNQSDKKLAIILNEKDVRAKDTQALLGPCSDYLDMVRLAVDPQNFRRALSLGEAVKALGFELTFNVMYMSNWGDYPALMESLPQLEGLADYLYMVDSFGGVFPEDVVRTIDMIRSRTSIPLGFHGHNNLELALINTLTALEHGVEIVDATVTGMGRGAGNLSTELLLTVLDAKGKLDFDYNALSKEVDAFSRLRKEHEWGTSLPYMVSGAHSLPQKEVMAWVTKRFYSFNSILRALANRSKGLEDNQKLPHLDFTAEKNYSGALIVGGGPSAVQHAEAIEAFLRQRPDMVIIHASSRNAMSYNHVSNDQFFCLVGNEGHRMEAVFGGAEKVWGKCILPPFPREMGTYIPSKLENRAYELKEVSFTDKLKDTHTALALQTARELGVDKVYIVGYDGYSGAAMGQREQELFRENEHLFEQARKAGMDCISLTSTNYQNICQDSIFVHIS